VGTADHDQDGVVGGRALPRRSEDLRSAAIVGHAPDYMRSGATGFTYRTSSTSALAWIFKIHTISALAGTCTFGTGSPASYPCAPLRGPSPPFSPPYRGVIRWGANFTPLTPRQWVSL